ncbi:4Fe-4S dicluster domain-containing protein, partial [Streptomyces sp. NPDC001215]
HLRNGGRPVVQVWQSGHQTVRRPPIRIDQRPVDGRAWKCTLCYDRLGVGMEPACAKSCPTDSIQFGPLEELHERAAARVARLHAAGVTDGRPVTGPAPPCT